MKYINVSNYGFTRLKCRYRNFFDIQCDLTDKNTASWVHNTQDATLTKLSLSRKRNHALG